MHISSPSQFLDSNWTKAWSSWGAESNQYYEKKNKRKKKKSQRSSNNLYICITDGKYNVHLWPCMVSLSLAAWECRRLISKLIINYLTTLKLTRTVSKINFEFISVSVLWKAHLLRFSWWLFLYVLIGVHLLHLEDEFFSLEWESEVVQTFIVCLYCMLLLAL